MMRICCLAFLVVAPGLSMAQQQPKEAPGAVFARVRDAQSTSDFQKLITYAKSDVNMDVRDAAMGRILASSQVSDSVLLDIVRTGTFWYERSRAARGIRRQDLLLQLFREIPDSFPDSGVRGAALEGIVDTAFLATVALHDTTVSYRRTALRRITDQRVLLRIAAKDVSYELREIAFRKVTDTAMVRSATSDSFPVHVRMTALERTGDARLARSFVNDTSKWIRRTVLPAVRDQKVLINIAISDKDSTVRRLAIERVQSDAVLKRIALQDDSPRNRLAAFVGVRNAALADSIAALTTDTVIKTYAREYIRITGILLGGDSVPLYPAQLGVAPVRDGRSTDESWGFGHTREDGWFAIMLQQRPFPDRIEEFRIRVEAAGSRANVGPRFDTRFAKATRSGGQLISTGKLVAPMLIMRYPEK